MFNIETNLDVFAMAMFGPKQTLHHSKEVAQAGLPGLPHFPSLGFCQSVNGFWQPGGTVGSTLPPGNPSLPQFYSTREFCHILHFTCLYDVWNTAYFEYECSDEMRVETVLT